MSSGLKVARPFALQRACASFSIAATLLSSASKKSPETREPFAASLTLLLITNAIFFTLQFYFFTEKSSGFFCATKLGISSVQNLFWLKSCVEAFYLGIYKPLLKFSSARLFFAL